MTAGPVSSPSARIDWYRLLQGKYEMTVGTKVLFEHLFVAAVYVFSIGAIPVVTMCLFPDYWRFVLLVMIMIGPSVMGAIVLGNYQQFRRRYIVFGQDLDRTKYDKEIGRRIAKILVRSTFAVFVLYYAIHSIISAGLIVGLIISIIPGVIVWQVVKQIHGLIDIVKNQSMLESTLIRSGNRRVFFFTFRLFLLALFAIILMVLGGYFLVEPTFRLLGIFLPILALLVILLMFRSINEAVSLFGIKGAIQ